MNISEPPLPARWLAQRLPSRRAGDIAARVAELIHRGEMPARLRVATMRLDDDPRHIGPLADRLLQAARWQGPEDFG